MTANPYRNLPAVNDVLATPAAAALCRDHGHEPAVAAVRAVLDKSPGPAPVRRAARRRTVARRRRRPGPPNT